MRQKLLAGIIGAVLMYGVMALFQHTLTAQANTATSMPSLTRWATVAKSTQHNVTELEWKILELNLEFTRMSAVLGGHIQAIDNDKTGLGVAVIIRPQSEIGQAVPSATRQELQEALSLFADAIIATTSNLLPVSKPEIEASMPILFYWSTWDDSFAGYLGGTVRIDHIPQQTTPVVSGPHRVYISPDDLYYHTGVCSTKGVNELLGTKYTVTDRASAETQGYKPHNWPNCTGWRD